MDYLVEFIIELIGNITGRCEPERMPENLEYKKSFTVKSYPKNLILHMLGVVALLVVFLLVYLGGEIVLGCVFAVGSVVLLITGIILQTGKYEIDDKRIVCMHLLSRKVIPWDSVKTVKLFEKTDDSSVTLALYSDDILLVDFISPKKNFWQRQKMAEHLGYEVIREKDIKLSKILHPK